ncbi:TetR/AcrR family transcriptional regulator [Svornostia abyssi]|uniref:TetR/AcrR family transcriptional regulator n=1 Tax=Svornostia abyssi TaxID=2898438 RepID=A0ABY5PL44_9ACTN|nr:TetR/AcrR family transcriptional regulator [Parviterribacteraceae bacterium J379]
MPTTQAQAPTRDRILFTSAELFRRQGYAGTGLKQVTTQAEAPFGSLYHFWPGGKEQLAEEVLRTGGDFFLALYRAIVDPAPDLLTGVRDFFTGAGETLVATGYLDACPIATVAGEVASTHEPLRSASADVFELWTAALTADLAHAGAPEEQARPLALAVIALLEGAFLLCRTLQSTEPMDAAADAAVALVRTALETQP